MVNCWFGATCGLEILEFPYESGTTYLGGYPLIKSQTNRSWVDVFFSVIFWGRDFVPRRISKKKHQHFWENIIGTFFLSIEDSQIQEYDQWKWHVAKKKPWHEQFGYSKRSEVGGLHKLIDEDGPNSLMGLVNLVLVSFVPARSKTPMKCPYKGGKLINTVVGVYIYIYIYPLQRFLGGMTSPT